MLEPERRLLLLDALRPPAGFTFDRAVGTTFTLDLVAMLVTPVAFAMFDVETDDGRTAANPIAILDAVRRHADRITIFCQSGMIRVPGDYRSAFAYLERSVVPVRPPRRDGIFHPKVWVIRFVDGSGAIRLRFLCLSRNLTFDRSWDTILRLDGEPMERPHTKSEPLADFVRSLPGLAVIPLEPDRRRETMALADEVATASWDSLPDGLKFERMWPIGHRGEVTWPFPEGGWRRLAVAPFVEPDFVKRFTWPGRGDLLVSRPETLDEIGREPLAHLGRRMVLQSDAETELEAAETTDDLAAPSEGPTSELPLVGLHAKLFVVDGPWWSQIWTGSANATLAAFSRNVEFLVEMRGRNTTHGAAALVDDKSGQTVGFGRLLTDYDPSPEPLPTPAEEHAAAAVDRVALALGALGFTARVAAIDDDHYRLDLVGSGDLKRVTSAVADGSAITVRPLSLGFVSAIEPAFDNDKITAAWSTSFLALTAFFVFKVLVEVDGGSREASILVKAVLVGEPEDRLDRVLTAELRSRSDLVRLLLLLLGGIEPAFGDLVDVISGERIATRPQSHLLIGSESLLEPLMRTLVRNPARLEEIERLVDRLVRTEEGRALLPDGWIGLWEAVNGARRPGAGVV